VKRGMSKAKCLESVVESNLLAVILSNAELAQPYNRSG
jgi:hypothetical protein